MHQRAQGSTEARLHDTVALKAICADLTTQPADLLAIAKGHITLGESVIAAQLVAGEHILVENSLVGELVTLLGFVCHMDESVGQRI